MRKIIILFMALCIMLSICACDKTESKETTETTQVTEETKPNYTNLFDTQDYALKTFQVGPFDMVLNDQVDVQLSQAGLKQGVPDMSKILVLGYTKTETQDGKTIFYQGTESFIDCFSYKIISDNLYFVASFKRMDADKLGITTKDNNPIGLKASNERFTYAGCITMNTTAEQALSIMGTPTEKKTDEDGAIQHLTYIHKNESGKIDNKIEMEFAAEKLYKISITQKLVQS